MPENALREREKIWTIFAHEANEYSNQITTEKKEREEIMGNRMVWLNAKNATEKNSQKKECT